MTASPYRLYDQPVFDASAETRFHRVEDDVGAGLEDTLLAFERTRLEALGD